MLVTIHRSLFNQIHKNFVTWTTNFFELFPEIYIERNLCQEAGWVYFLLFTYVFSFCKKSDFGLNHLILDFRDKRPEDWEERGGFLVVSEGGLGFFYFLLLLRCCLPADLAATTFSNSFIHSLEVTAVICAELQGIESDLSCHEKGIWWIQDGQFGTGLIFILGKIIAVPH